MQPPGTPLGPGFTVADGAHLLGVVFPNEHDDGWRAVLLVTGDVGAVFETYRQQAAAAGVPFRGAKCEDAAGVLKCEGDGASDDGRRALRVAVWRGYVGDNRTPVSHGYLERHDVTDSVRPAARPVGAVLTAPPRPLPTGWELPDVGGTFGDGVLGISVEPDSELVAPIGFASGGTGPGFRGVLRVHRNPLVVMRRYDTQWPNDRAALPPAPWSDPDGSYVLVDDGGRVGGESYRIEIVTRPGHPGWAWVTASRP